VKKDMEQVVEKTEEKIAVIYVVVKCPRCQAIYVDDLPMNYEKDDLSISNYELLCPICGRAIYIGEPDHGEEFQ
jgi:Zn finger protein HypA/HybF involved in hydrogenase expression